MKKTGILLINLGTPDSYEPEAVGKYLREFLMDPWVIDIPSPLRWILVNLLIVPRRKYDSAKLYRKVWMAEGSPLLHHSLELTRRLCKELSDYPVSFGMRYGQPSIESALSELRAAGASQIFAIPLYPQYSLAATESSVRFTQSLAEKLCPEVELKFMPAFYGEDEYLDATAKVTAAALGQINYDLLLFSFHGLPERQVKKTDKSGRHCLMVENCCDQISDVNRDCYRAQSYATARELVRRLGVPSEKYRVGFQSRLKGAPWIQPFSDEFYRNLPKTGIKRLAVACPSFVADCLETLEEVQMRGNEEFRAHGGESLHLIPSLNAEPVWVSNLAKMIRRQLPA